MKRIEAIEAGAIVVAPKDVCPDSGADFSVVTPATREHEREAGKGSWDAYRADRSLGIGKDWMYRLPGNYRFTVRRDVRAIHESRRGGLKNGTCRADEFDAIY